MAPFHAGSGALRQRDLAPRLGRADPPCLTEAGLTQVKRWTDAWRSRNSGAMTMRRAGNLPDNGRTAQGSVPGHRDECDEGAK